MVTLYDMGRMIKQPSMVLKNWPFTSWHRKWRGAKWNASKNIGPYKNWTGRNDQSDGRPEARWPIHDTPCQILLGWFKHTQELGGLCNQPTNRICIFTSKDRWLTGIYLHRPIDIPTPRLVAETFLMTCDWQQTCSDYHPEYAKEHMWGPLIRWTFNPLTKGLFGSLKIERWFQDIRYCYSNLKHSIILGPLTNLSVWVLVGTHPEIENLIRNKRKQQLELTSV